MNNFPVYPVGFAIENGCLEEAAACFAVIYASDLSLQAINSFGVNGRMELNQKSLSYFFIFFKLFF